MNAQEKDRALAKQMADAINPNASRMWDLIPDARTLRRAQMTLHRWAEMECGDGRGHIERDEQTGKPFYYNDNARYVQANDPRRVSSIPDREAGALRRVAEACKAAGLHYYHQTDPRGCALYVAAEPLNAQNYSSRGIPCL
jgi:hypothetical protein